MTTLGAACAAVLVAVAVLASAAGPALLAAALGIVALILCLGALRSAPVVGVGAAAWIASGVAVGSLVWMVTAAEASPASVSVLLGPALLVILFLQLLRRGRGTSLTAAVGLGTAAVGMSLLTGFWLAARFTPAGMYVVPLAMVGVGVVALAEALPVAGSVRRIVGVLLAVVASALIVLQVPDVAAAVPAVSAVVIAVFAAVAAALAFAVVDRIEAEGALGVRPLPDPVAVPEPAQVGVEPAAVATADVHASPLTPAAGTSAADPSRRARLRSAARGARAGVLAKESGTRASAGTALLALRVSLPIILPAPFVYLLVRVLVG